jgi:hypothetical protein
LKLLSCAGFSYGIYFSFIYALFVSNIQNMPLFSKKIVPTEITAKIGEFFFFFFFFFKGEHYLKNKNKIK